MNNEPHAVPAILLSRRNESIIQLRTYHTIFNDMSNFHDLHKLYYDIQNAQVYDIFYVYVCIELYIRKYE